MTHLKKALVEIETKGLWPTEAPLPNVQLKKNPVVISETPDAPVGKTVEQHLEPFVQNAVQDVLTGKVKSSLRSTSGGVMPLINAANAGSFVGWRMEYWNKYIAGGEKGTAKKKAQRWKLKDFVGTILEITSEETVLDSGTSTTTALVRWDAEKDGTKYNDEPVFLVESLWGAHADHGWYISKPEAQEETAVHGDALADMKAARLKAEFALMELT